MSEKIKSGLHHRNKHRKGYDFQTLMTSEPTLTEYVSPNKYGNLSIDFFNPEAVLSLNKALLKTHYSINYWSIPSGYLCPPVPGRADYIHHVADLLADSNKGKIPRGARIKCMDIGVGANCIYPIVGAAEYDWSFVGVDIDEKSIDSARAIVDANDHLISHVDLRIQQNPECKLSGVLKENEFIDVVISNPPFHASRKAANEASNRKLRNLKGKKIRTPKRNFGGQSNELWCPGGEVGFISEMINESKTYSKQCMWYTSLVSREDSLNSLINLLENVEVVEKRVIPMGQGNKKSRILAWTFLSERHRKIWAKSRF